MATLTPTQINKITSILHTARTDEQTKLQFGQRQRSQMFEDIRNSEGKDDAPVTKSDRYQWIVATRKEIMTLLVSQATKYNAAHPHDRIAVQDFMDVIQTVLNGLRANLAS